MIAVLVLLLMIAVIVLLLMIDVCLTVAAAGRGVHSIGSADQVLQASFLYAHAFLTVPVQNQVSSMLKFVLSHTVTDATANRFLKEDPALEKRNSKLRPES